MPNIRTWKIQNKKAFISGMLRTNLWYGSKYSPVKTAQPAAAASDMLWPERVGKKEPPITATGVNLYKCFNSPISQARTENKQWS